jgi:hypothetical protein
MKIQDRLIAKKTPNNEERWNECSLKELGDEKSIV